MRGIWMNQSNPEGGEAAGEWEAALAEEIVSVIGRLSYARPLSDAEKQEVVVEVWKGMRGVRCSGAADGIRNREAYITTAARHAIERLRARRRRRERREVSVGPEDLDGDGRSERRSLEDRVACKVDLEAALRDLPERQRMVVTLVYLEGKTQKEVSRELGITPASVQWSLVMAKKAMRPRLSPDLP
jgi:RNA polymerase sigma factor (sigma-70 family)